MAEKIINLADAPFRSGITGKYKLLVKSVVPKYVNYEYELVDADGKEYAAGHPKHYAEGDLLRCMVFFKVANAKLVVTETLICNKQDLATAIPEVKKPQPQKEEPKKVISDNKPVDDPRKAGKSGFYSLRVVDYERINGHYSYLVEDVTGIRFKVGVQTKHFYPIGSVKTCHMKVSVLPGGELSFKVVSICKDKKEKPKPSKKHKVKHVKRSYKSSSSRDWLGTPCVGDHFHLIYTPMGNKR